ncbi:MAG: hypothetical protein JXA37_01560 [Chloroflexia bacterium]|nr:hypothetical protein [Chloroflexia bacterium]
MDLKHIASIQFVDQNSGRDALILVRAKKDTVSLDISLIPQRSLEIVLGLQEGEKLVEQLGRALDLARYQDELP